MRPSKSDTSLTDSYVMIDKDKQANENVLRKGLLAVDFVVNLF